MKKTILRDHQLGKVYTYLNEDKKTYKAKNKFGETVTINKSQATKMYWSNQLNTYVTIPE